MSQGMTNETGQLKVNNGELCETAHEEWVTGKSSDEKVYALSPSGGTSSEILLSVQVPSCQNFALGDSQRKHGQKFGLPLVSELFLKKTENAHLEESAPLVEDKTKTCSRSLNEGYSSDAEPRPVFSELTEKLLFGSDPLFDDSDTEQENVFLSSREVRKIPDDTENDSKMLKTLINHLEGLSKSLGETAKSSSTLGSKMQLKEQVVMHSSVPYFMDPPSKKPSPLLFDTIQDGHTNTQPRFIDFLLPKLEYSETSSKTIRWTKDSVRPSLTSLATIQSDETLSSPSSEACGTSLATIPSDETLSSPSSEACVTSVRANNKKQLHVTYSLKQLGDNFAESSALSLEKSVHAETATDHPVCLEPPQFHDESMKSESLGNSDSSLINYGGSFNPTVQLTASKFGMAHSSERWDILWVNRDPSFNKQSVTESIEMYKNLKSHQRVNHFPGSWGLGLKDLCAKNLNYMCKFFPEEYKFFPKTWILPKQIMEVESYSFQHPEIYFTVKPTDSRTNDDIKITKDLDETCDGSFEQVCQVYIKPFLIDGYNFGFRVYALVTSCDPLRVFVFNEGLARFATEKYKDPTDKNSMNKFMHLTNTRVNLRSPNYLQDEFRGSLHRISTVFKWLEFSHCDVGKIQAAIDSAIVKTIIANLATLRDYYQICFSHHTYPSACFEILGFDIMLDNRLNVYLLDVDCSPSFDCESGDPFEAELKADILNDTFVILNLPEKRRNEVRKEKFRRLTLFERLMKRKQEMKLTESQTEWEDSHLGRFRKIYPPVVCKCYQKLVDKALKNPHII